MEDEEEVDDSIHSFIPPSIYLSTVRKEEEEEMQVKNGEEEKETGTKV